MKFYQELTLIDNAEKPQHVVWSLIYNQVHIALSDIKNKEGVETIGIGFPQYKFEEKDGMQFSTLGGKLRLFSEDKTALERLNLKKWLGSLNDLVHISSIKAVPDDVNQYMIVKRYRCKTPERKAMDYAVLKRISFDQAMEHVEKYCRKPIAYPAIQLKSKTNKQNYLLAFQQEVVDKEHKGKFNAYGINNQTGESTVPCW